MTFSFRDLLGRSRAIAENRERMRLEGEHAIATTQFVPIGGLDQWISIRGEDRRRPVLLLVHGGPGATTSMFSPLVRSWEKHFTVVHWDQRGAGKTFGRHGARASGPLTIAGLADDGIALTEALRTQLAPKKLFVLGSSAGSVIALSMIRRRPDLFDAYVGTDQNVGGDRESVGLRLALEALRASGNVRDARRLEAMGKDPSHWTTEIVDRRNRIVASASNGAPNMIMDVTMPALFASPDHGWRDIVDVARGLHHSLGQLGLSIARFDARAEGTRFAIPFIVLQGAADVVTPTELARRFVDDVQAPFKTFRTIEGAGHLAAFAQPERFLAAMREALDASTHD